MVVEDKGVHVHTDASASAKVIILHLPKSARALEQQRPEAEHAVHTLLELRVVLVDHLQSSGPASHRHALAGGSLRDAALDIL